MSPICRAFCMRRFHIASSGRPGPVVVDVPKDVQFAKGTYLKPKEFQHKGYRPKLKGDPDKIAGGRADGDRQWLLFYTGGGVINSGSAAISGLRELAKLTGFPGTSTVMGLGAFPAADPQWLGMLGMHGTGSELGDARSRPDDRGRLALRRPHHRSPRRLLARFEKFHIDIEPSSINKNVKVDLSIVGDCAHVLEDMLRLWRAGGHKPDKKALDAWWAQINKWRTKNSLAYRNSNEIIKPQYAIQRLYELTKDRDTYITTEVGQHQMWAAQFYQFQEGNRWMTSGGLGTMGYGCRRRRRTAGTPEFARHRHRRRSLGVDEHAGDVDGGAARSADQDFILNNQYMGMVRQWQELMHGGRYSHSYTEALPDFVKLADAYHAHGIRCEHPGELDEKIREMIDVKKPVIFDCVVDPAENCFPMIPSGRAHNEMLLGDAATRIEDAVTEEGKMLV